jgi:ATP-dependent Clp protease ATP-binding subunit ClpA
VFLYQFTSAHQSIKNFFGNLFTVGYFTDPEGRTVYAGNTIFVLSTTCENKGVSIGFGSGGVSENETKQPDIKEHLKRRDTPLGVIDSINEFFWFESLSRQQIKQIIEKRILKTINQPGVKELDIRIVTLKLDSQIDEYMADTSSLRNF